jgi:hypothetical protein
VAALEVLAAEHHLRRQIIADGELQQPSRAHPGGEPEVQENLFNREYFENGFLAPKALGRGGVTIKF